MVKKKVNIGKKDKNSANTILNKLWVFVVILSVLLILFGIAANILSYGSVLLAPEVSVGFASEDGNFDSAVNFILLGIVGALFIVTIVLFIILVRKRKMAKFSEQKIPNFNVLMFFIVIVIFVGVVSGQVEEVKKIPSILVLASPENRDQPLWHSDRDFILDQVINSPDSVIKFWKDNSYGTLELVGMDGEEFGDDDIIGPVTYSYNPEEDRVPDKVFNILKEMEDISLVNHGIIMIITAHCSPSGFATRSVEYEYKREVINLNFVTICGNGRSLTRSSLIHELGHIILKSEHSIYVKCNPDSTLKPEDCEEIIEYGSFFDILGWGVVEAQSNAQSLMFGEILVDDLNARHRIETIEREGSYFIKPIASLEEGVKALRLPHRSKEGIGNLEYLTVEWKQPIGLDNKIRDYGAEEIYEGILLHVSKSGWNYLINPIENEIECQTRSNCPKMFNAYLPYGESYTDPNTGTRIRVGDRPLAGEELEIIVEEMGRTDFEKPVLNGINVVERSEDYCNVVIEVEAYDPGHEGESDGGISKVEFYHQNHGSSRLTGELISNEGNRLDFDYTTMGGIDIKVYDKASEDGGNYEDNLLFIESYFPQPEERYSCVLQHPSILVESQQFENSYYSEDLIPIGFASYETARIFDLDFIGEFTSPLNFNMITEGESNINAFEIDELYFESNAVISIIDGNYYFNEPIHQQPQFSEIETNINLNPGRYRFSIWSRGSLGYKTTLYFNIEIVENNPFIRGDVNGDSRLDMDDSIVLLDYIFQYGQTPSCADATDANDDGVIDMSDAVFILNYLFLGVDVPGELGQEVFDSTHDELDCSESNVLKHGVCLDNQCGLAAGEGEDECTSGADCCFSDDATIEFPEGINPFVVDEGEMCKRTGLLEEKHCISRAFQTFVDVDCSDYGDYSCINGACNCNEGDTNAEYPHGDNPYVRTSEEYCQDVRILTEKSCRGNSQIDCTQLGEDYTCRSGRCISCLEFEGDVSEEFPNGNDPFFQSGFGFNYRDFCENGLLHERNCIAPDFEEIIDCSELGDYVCLSGSCISCSDIAPDASDEFPFGDDPFVDGGDFCDDEYNLVEFDCREGIGSVIIDCRDYGNYQCQDGACVPAE